METGRAPDPYLALRHGEYRWFLGGAFALFMGTQIQTVALGWQVYALTGDPLSLGFIGLAEALPFLALTLWGGQAADLMDRRLLAVLSAFPILGGALWLLAVNLGTPPRQVWIFYAAQVLAGVGRAFHRPASAALGSEIVPREAYANAATWRSAMFHTAMVAGPALGGLLVAWSPRVAYGVEAALMILGLAAFAFLRPRPRPPESRPGSSGILEGVRFVLREKVVLGALSLDLFAVLFGGAAALLPAFARDILRVGGLGFGLLRAAPALGSILMSLLLAHLPPLRRAGRAMLLCVAAFGACWIAFALSRSFALSILLLALSGAFDNVSVVLRATLVQIFTPQELMGRVSAVNSFFIGSSNELGAFESGVAARLLGLVPSVVFGGAMTLVVVAATAWSSPELRKLRNL
ncbi:MAG: MFS transporter [Acidobacteria bacterium]|nr:MFS transporter [Acidobacteriota bacterium]